ncbi:hypothetical protein QPK87_09780 [Kamptonema cortianum]|nr:hypothetical protein [Geitlerinema splendidum]MDK3156864.1 hypothetical protein [Kamptonema cortianum]
MKRALTALELMVVISILLLLVAIMSPTFARARESAKITGSLARLKQLYIAVEMYAINEGGDALSPAHLPTLAAVQSNWLGLGKEFFISPCGINQIPGKTAYESSYAYFPHDYVIVLEQYMEKYGVNAVIWSDPNCNPPLAFDVETTTKRGLAVTAGGNLINHYKRGNPYRPEWWSSIP